MLLALLALLLWVVGFYSLRASGAEQIHSFLIASAASLAGVYAATRVLRRLI